MSDQNDDNGTQDGDGADEQQELTAEQQAEYDKAEADAAQAAFDATNKGIETGDRPGDDAGDGGDGTGGADDKGGDDTGDGGGDDKGDQGGADDGGDKGGDGTGDGGDGGGDDGDELPPALQKRWRAMEGRVGDLISRDKRRETELAQLRKERDDAVASAEADAEWQAVESEFEQAKAAKEAVLQEFNDGQVEIDKVLDANNAFARAEVKYEAAKAKRGDGGADAGGADAGGGDNAGGAGGGTGSGDGGDGGGSEELTDEEVAARRASVTAVLEKHPDMVEVNKNPEFVKWVEASPQRVLAGQSWDSDVAIELLDQWKAHEKAQGGGDNNGGADKGGQGGDNNSDALNQQVGASGRRTRSADSGGGKTEAQKVREAAEAGFEEVHGSLKG